MAEYLWNWEVRYNGYRMANKIRFGTSWDNSVGRSNRASRRVGSRRAFLDLCGPSTMTSSIFFRLFPDGPVLSPEGRMLRDASVSMDERLRMSIYIKKSVVQVGRKLEETVKS